MSEWSLTLFDQFQRILEQEINKIQVGPLNAYGIENMLRDHFSSQPSFKFKSVNLDIIREILDKGQGNPMVSEIVISSMIEANLLCVKNNTLMREEGKELQLGMGFTAAVIAQYDKLSAHMKSVLRVLAMGEQTLKVTDICMSLEYLKKNTKGDNSDFDISPENVVNLISEHDKYKFIRLTDNDNEMCFSHYLIQQAIISSMMPTKREEIRNAFIRCYENAVETETDPKEKALLRQSLIYHLLKVDGDDDKKKLHVYEAFVEAGDANQTTEALTHYDNLNSFRSTFDCADTVFKKLREYRILSRLYFEIG
ncbi:UNVERIFIED_CONTAM: hypothetical protein HDU68_003128 [Siphonaria sp. JEL0065]|nr:hypothetical protein HDU68_003128 [Siphonaria sp. JEL0065]